MLELSVASSSEGTPPSPPVERNPSNDDWGATITAIAVMSLLAFIALSVLIKKSFQLVPTGVLALRTLVSDRPAGYHQLDPNDSDDESGVPTREEVAPSGADHRRLEILRDDESIDGPEEADNNDNV
ncbi:hypothetical protein H4S07_003085 [Coemansia furcata]|uniref:Uncharacterized protein n=1 Tax=Coemansia furcata TaxID=417177 RepID=A0ACC1LIA4_9FUNG|nr:hypothetical protein H4S07_003085 [Coemansia furcata]